MRRRSLVLVVFLLVALTVGVQSDSSRETTPPTPSSPAASGTSTTETSTVAAVVNGEEISRSDLAAVTNVGAIVQSFYMQFPTFVEALLTTPEGKAFMTVYERKVLDQLVDSRLLVQQAVLLGAEADEAQVASQVDQQITQIQTENEITAADMERILVQQGSSLAQYRERLSKTFRERAMVDRLHTQIVQDVAVSDAEISAYYAESASQFTDSAGKARPLDEVKDQIRQTILTNAQGKRWEEWLANVRREATIEIRL